MDLKYIENIAKNFRHCIEKNKDQMGIVFKEFPHGACGDTSLLLGKYLNEILSGHFEYESGEKYIKNDFSSHAWIKHNNYYIDITADQFPEHNNSIVITKDSTWYQTFTITNHDTADFSGYDSRTESYLESLYRIIIACMNSPIS